MSLPDFRCVAFLRGHVARTMAFYHPRAIDPSGGFFHYFRDDGTIYERSHRHLVSSTRFVYCYAKAAREFRDADYDEAASHGVKYLIERHRLPSGGYAWTLRDGAPEDRTNHAYGVAFVLLAFATSGRASHVAQTWDLLEDRYWDAGARLYRDEADADWNFSGYRGQNANMHLTEALLAAYEATGGAHYLDRAETLASRVTRDLAAQGDGFVWEHYDVDWRVDWDYHREDPKHLFRPWGFQPGHQIEWAKLLLTLKRCRPEREWLLPRAQELFDRAVALAWDTEHEGLVYGLTPDGAFFDDDKYFWVQAEAIATAALLGARTGDARYWAWYDRLWAYAWRHFVDHEHGAWFRILDRANRKYGDEKSPAGKTDYHTMGACHEVIALLRRQAGDERCAS